MWKGATAIYLYCFSDQTPNILISYWSSQLNVDEISLQNQHTFNLQQK